MIKAARQQGVPYGLPPTCPTLALHASLLIDPATQPFPFQGVWPDIGWTMETRQAWMSVAACRVLPQPLWDADHPCTARELFWQAEPDQCLLPRKGGPNMCAVPGAPAFMQDSYWTRHRGAGWAVQLQRPAESARAAAVESVVQRFQGAGPQAGARREEMLRLLGEYEQYGQWLAVRRVLCWDANGAPSREGKPAQGLLLQGIEGHNTACHAGCAALPSLCLNPVHLSWGTPATVAQLKREKSRARVKQKLSNFRKGASATVSAT